MNYRQIETSREIRLWIGQIIVPTITIIAAVPEARHAVVNQFKGATQKIKDKFKKD